MPLIDQFCLAGKKLNARTAILNVKTRSIVSMGIGSGTDYLSGDVISLPVALPENMYHFKYESLYLGRGEKGR